MGDSIMGLSTVSYLKSIFPKAKVSYATPAWVAPLYDKVQTDADEILPVDLKSLNGLHMRDNVTIPFHAFQAASKVVPARSAAACTAKSTMNI